VTSIGSGAVVWLNFFDAVELLTGFCLIIPQALLFTQLAKSDMRAEVALKRPRRFQRPALFAPVRSRKLRTVTLLTQSLKRLTRSLRTAAWFLSSEQNPANSPLIWSAAAVI